MTRTRELTKMGRRRFLKTLGVLGTSTSALRYMSKDALADITDNPEKEVIRLTCLRFTNPVEVIEGGTPDGYEPVFHTIPRDEWVRIEAAKDARRKISQRLNTTRRKYIETFVKIGKNGEREVVVKYNWKTMREPSVDSHPQISPESINQVIPSTIDGEAGEGKYARVVEDIPVKFEIETKQEAPDTPEINNFDSSDLKGFDKIPAGAGFGSYEDELPDPNEKFPSGGTIGTPAYNENKDENILVTAAHCFNEEKNWKMWIPRRTVGESRKILYESNILGPDAATVELDNEEDVKYEIFGSPASTILGFLGWDMIERGTDIHRTGYKSGTDEGKITLINEDTGTFHIGLGSRDGDSGGPVYEIRDGYPWYGVEASYVAGVLRSGNRSSSKVTGIEKIINELGVRY